MAKLKSTTGKGWEKIPSPIESEKTIKVRPPKEVATKVTPMLAQRDIQFSDLENLSSLFKKASDYDFSITDKERIYIKDSSDTLVMSITLWSRNSGDQPTVYFNVYSEGFTKNKDDLCVIRLNQGRLPIQDFLNLISGVIESVLFT